MAAKFEKVIVHPNVLLLQHLGPNLGQLLFHRIARHGEFPLALELFLFNGSQCGEVDFAVSVDSAASRRRIAVSKESPMAKTYKEIMAEARTLVPELAPAEVKQKLDRGEKPVLLDVREKEEYRDGHLEGALSLPRGFLEMRVEETVPDGRLHRLEECRSAVRHRPSMDAGAGDALQPPFPTSRSG